MRRMMDSVLSKWTDTDDAKPLLLRGARQVGKTYCVRQLGKRFRHFVEINFEETPEASHLRFLRNTGPHSRTGLNFSEARNTRPLQTPTVHFSLNVAPQYVMIFI